MDGMMSHLIKNDVNPLQELPKTPCYCHRVSSEIQRGVVSLLKNCFKSEVMPALELLKSLCFFHGVSSSSQRNVISRNFPWKQCHTTPQSLSHISAPPPPGSHQLPVQRGQRILKFQFIQNIFVLLTRNLPKATSKIKTTKTKH